MPFEKGVKRLITCEELAARDKSLVKSTI